MRRAQLIVAWGLALAALTTVGRCSPRPSVPRPPEGYKQRPAGMLNFSEHIAPIVFDNCVTCHRAGGSAPFDLSSYAEVRKRARQIARVTAEHFMPPWLPEEGYGRFVGERRLGDEQIGILGQWAAEGAGEGDPADLPPAPEFVEGWQLGAPDLVVPMPETYTLKGEAGDVFRNFVFPVGLTETRYVRTIEFRPTNVAVLHHATIAVDPTPASRYHDAADPEIGFDGMINTNARRPDGHLLGWLPGKLPFEGRDDIAWRLDADADLIVQLHMQPSGKTESVRPSIGLHFADEPPGRTAFLLRLGSMVIDIPPGVPAYEVSDTYVLPIDVEVLGIVPHAHYLGKEMESYAVLPDGSREWLLRIRDWDFSWQDEYRYAEPVLLPKGSALTMRYTYDNTRSNVRNPHHPPRRVRFGPETDDEMGDLWVQVLPVDDAELEILRRDFLLRDRQAYIDGARQILEHDPEDRLIRNTLGKMLATQGKLDEAIEHFRRILETDPDYVLAHGNLGNALMDRGELEEAAAHYREAIRLKPEQPEPHFNLGQVLKLQGRLDEAIDEYRRALELRPGLGRAHFVLGNVYLAQRRLDTSEHHYREAIHLDGNNAQAHNNLGTLLAQRGLLEDAAVEFRNAVTLQPDHAKAHFNLGQALVQLGRTDEAIEQFRETLSWQPDHAQARRSLDLVLEGAR